MLAVCLHIYIFIKKLVPNSITRRAEGTDGIIRLHYCMTEVPSVMVPLPLHLALPAAGGQHYFPNGDNDQDDD